MYIKLPTHTENDYIDIIKCTILDGLKLLTAKRTVPFSYVFLEGKRPLLEILKDELADLEEVNMKTLSSYFELVPLFCSTIPTELLYQAKQYFAQLQ